MKRLFLLVFFLFWGLGIIFMISFFRIMSSTYKSQASKLQATVLKIMPFYNYDNQNWTEADIRQMASQYSGLIIQTQDLANLKQLINRFRQQNRDFQFYLQVSPTQTSASNSDYNLISQQPNWLLEENIIDIREPTYRQHFFDYWQTQMTNLNLNGILLTGVDRCPPGVDMLDCESQYGWWEMSINDFIAQIRQYFSNRTILIAASPIINNRQDFAKAMLRQADGLVIEDFASIKNNELFFSQYYHFLTSLLQDPQFVNKQLVYQIRADESNQRFFMASYLLFANDHSSYYFSSQVDNRPDWNNDWQQSYSPSLNLPFLGTDSIYQRILGNAVILVNSTNYSQTVSLDQKILEGKACRLWNEQPINFLDSIIILPGSAQVININLPESITAIDSDEARLADWSDRNTSLYSDFETVYLNRASDSPILGSQVSLESTAKNYDDFDDGLSVDGLDAGIFNLNRSQNYTFTVKLSNLTTSGYQLFVWVDWDGKGMLAPELVYQINHRNLLSQSFNLTVPEYAKEHIFMRLILKDQESGEVEDYLLTIQSI